MSSLGVNIRQLRASCSMTQEDLAQRINVNRATVANWEIGRTSPDQGTIVEIANLFCVTTDWLLGRPEYEMSAGPDMPQLICEIGSVSSADLVELWEELAKRESLQDLFRYADGLNDDAIRKLVEIVKLMKNP